jgi:hypothetical protein
LTVGLARGMPVTLAAAAAARAAARVVEGPGMGRLGDVSPDEVWRG